MDHLQDLVEADLLQDLVEADLLVTEVVGRSPAGTSGATHCQW